MPRKPTAFEVSFGEEAPQTSLSSSSKRYRGGNDNEMSERPTKQKVLPPVNHYISEPERCTPETEDLVIPGEILDDLEDDQKPIRILTDFVIFDPLHRNEMISLSEIEEDDGVNRHFEGVGWVFPHYLDEDEGQEEDQQGEEYNANKVYVKLGAILRYSVDYTKENEEFYIETIFAWYILRKPSASYEETYNYFYTPRRVAQLVISAAIRRPTYSYDSFLERYQNMVDIFGRTCQELDLWNAALTLRSILDDTAELSNIRSVPLVKRILDKGPNMSRPRSHGRQSRIQNLPQFNRSVLGNMTDTEVLKAGDQNQTQVTPRIANLMRGYVMEDVCVLGHQSDRLDKHHIEAQREMEYKTVCMLARITWQKRNIDWRKEDRFSSGSDYVRSVTINGKQYNVGDHVLVPIADEDGPPKKLPNDGRDIPLTARIPEFFWFAQIIYFVPSPSQIQRESYAHVRWLEHGSQIFLEELAHPQELFLNDLCGDIRLETIVERVVVHEKPQRVPDNPQEYFFKFKHDKETATLASADFRRSQLVANAMPPDNCPVCPLSEEREQASEPRLLRIGDGITGVALRGHTFHKYDFILFKARQGPAHVGHIKKISRSFVTVNQVGRITSFPKDNLPDSICRDERHVYLTDDEETVDFDDLLQTVHVKHIGDFRDSNGGLEQWLEESPDHFYVKYSFPYLSPESWFDRRRIVREEFKTCQICCKEKLTQSRLLKKFLSEGNGQPMGVLDLFGGIGAFSLGLKEGFESLKITHTIEILPSAAKAFKQNSPETVVYNQCANTMLWYGVKKREGHAPKTPKSLGDGRPVPDLPNKGEIQLITAGFPCQSHSGLNMFKHASDPKSNLIFNTLSYIDEYRPDFAYFENVPGFLQYALGTRQASKHRLEGGLKMGGLKVVVRALVDMGYQVRFCLLQAAHYGTPQRRIRFFLVAAREGRPLPELPQPTHDFPDNKALEIKFTNGDRILPIKTENGIGLHSHVKIDDAISDLPQYDWAHPRPRTPEREEMHRRRIEEDIPSLNCVKNSTDWFCGYKGASVDYRHEPKTRFQSVVRRRPTRDLQHYTKRFPPKKVERVVSIPMEPNADFTSLPVHLAEWQTSNAVSYVARHNRTGLYGRLDGNDVFPTTVTNVDPTAKQSRVLHPHCKRMVTIRELARSQGLPDYFVFKAFDNRVMTLHRQIGNAVPSPVAAALGRCLRDALFKEWLENRQNLEDDSDGAMMEED